MMSVNLRVFTHTTRQRPYKLQILFRFISLYFRYWFHLTPIADSMPSYHPPQYKTACKKDIAIIVIYIFVPLLTLAPPNPSKANTSNSICGIKFILPPLAIARTVCSWILCVHGFIYTESLLTCRTLNAHHGAWISWLATPSG